MAVISYQAIVTYEVYSGTVERGHSFIGSYEEVQKFIAERLKTKPPRGHDYYSIIIRNAG